MVPRSFFMSAPWRLCHRDVHRQQNARRRVDRHRRGDLLQRDLVEQLLHIVNGRNRNAHLPHFALRDRVVRVVADLGRQIEGDAQAGLSLPEQIAIALIGFLRRGEARILAHRPETRAIHRRLDAARIGIFAREAEFLYISSPR